MDENSFFLMRFHTSGMAITTPSTAKVRQSNDKVIFFMVSMPKNTVSAIVRATERIKPPRAGRMPAINLFTGGYFKRFFITAATSKMRIKEGQTTPTVARSAPKNPPYSYPI